MSLTFLIIFITWFQTWASIVVFNYAEGGASPVATPPCLPNSTGNLSEACRIWIPFKRAKRVSECITASKPFLVHNIHAVISTEHRFVYVDNVKAGSSTIRGRLKAVFNADWHHFDVPDKSLDCRLYRRTTTACLDGAHLRRRGWFIFSFVREPVAKLESGLGQAHYQRNKTGQFPRGETKESILEMELSHMKNWERRNASLIRRNGGHVRGYAFYPTPEYDAS